MILISGLQALTNLVQNVYKGEWNTNMHDIYVHVGLSPISLPLSIFLYMWVSKNQGRAICTEDNRIPDVKTMTGLPAYRNSHIQPGNACAQVGRDPDPKPTREREKEHAYSHFHVPTLQSLQQTSCLPLSAYRSTDFRPPAISLLSGHIW